MDRGELGGWGRIKGPFGGWNVQRFRASFEE